MTYSLHSGEIFDPTELAEAVTPEAARQALSQGHHAKALLLALRLKDTDMMQHMVLSIPADQVRESCLHSIIVHCNLQTHSLTWGAL